MISKKGKKGSLGTTLTWFVGFSLAVVVIVIFISATALLAGKKVLNKDKNSIEFKELELGNTETQGILVKVLNSQLSEGISVEEKITEVENGKSEYGDSFEEDINKIIKEYSDVFIFDIDFIAYWIRLKRAIA